MENISSLLKRYNINPKKSLGQNFLIDNSAVDKIVNAAEISKIDMILEIGAGLGNLTLQLAEAARHVVAVELDNRLLQPLEEILAGKNNIELIHGDILKLNPAELMGVPGYLVVANIPYYITSALIRHLLEADIKPARLVLTVQSEVAARMCAMPGEMNLLALSVQVYGQPYIVANIPAASFFPSPVVDSAVVRVDLLPEPFIPKTELDLFFHLAKAGFSQKRKTLRNSISAGMRISTTAAQALLVNSQIDPMRRAETLSLEEWKYFTQTYHAGNK